MTFLAVTPQKIMYLFLPVAYLAVGWSSMKSPNYEVQSEYRVTIKATDPSGDYKYVNVTITITNVNEVPDWAKLPVPEDRVPYPENETKVVSTYKLRRIRSRPRSSIPS